MKAKPRKQPAPAKGVYVRDLLSRVWLIEGIGPKRVIVRYLMTGGRFYHKRRLFDSHLKRGIYKLYESMV